MRLIKQFWSLYALMSLLGMNCAWIDEKNNLAKLCYYVYSNGLLLICAALINANICTDCKFAVAVNCTQKHTVYAAEVLLAYQTLVILWIMRNYYIFYAEDHILMLLRLECLCDELELNLRLLANKTCACLAIVLIPKLALLVPFYVSIFDQNLMVTLILASLVMNTLIIVIYIIECTVVIKVLGGLLAKLEKIDLNGDRYYHYGMLLLETVDVINDFYGVPFLLVCTQQLSWLTVFLYRHLAFPEEMMHFNDTLLRAWNRFVMAASVAMVLDFLFASSSTISKVCKFVLVIEKHIRTKYESSETKRFSILQGFSLCATDS